MPPKRTHPGIIRVHRSRGGIVHRSLTESCAQWNGEDPEVGKVLRALPRNRRDRAGREREKASIYSGERPIVVMWPRWVLMRRLITYAVNTMVGKMERQEVVVLHTHNLPGYYQRKECHIIPVCVFACFLLVVLDHLCVFDECEMVMGTFWQRKGLHTLPVVPHYRGWPLSYLSRPALIDEKPWLVTS